MRVPKRGQRRLMLRLFPWTKPSDWICVDRQVWKMTPEAAERAKQMRSSRATRRNPSSSLWAPAERSEKFTLVTDGQRYGAIHPGQLLPPGYSEWRVVQRGLPSLEACQKAADEDARAWETLNEKRNNPYMGEVPPPRLLSHSLGRTHAHSTKRAWNELAKETASQVFSRGDSDHINSLKDLQDLLSSPDYHLTKDKDFAKLVWRYVTKRHASFYKGRSSHSTPLKLRLNPVPASAPSRALLCIGQLRQLEIYDPKTGRTGTMSPKGKWLAWDGKQFQICNVKGQVNAELPPNIVQRHKKFHAANPQGKPFLASMPDRGPTVKNVGLLKSLVYYVPSKIRSPGKNKYLWHHAFGDTGHKGGDSYPTSVMPMLQSDSAGNLFIKRRPGNIFRVDNWLRG